MIATALRVFEPYLLEVVFDNGEVRRVDLQPTLHGQMFEPLRDPALFAQVQVDPVLGTVVWPNGADLSPSFFTLATPSRLVVLRPELPHNQRPSSHVAFLW